jgi:hypothetical protein
VTGSCFCRYFVVANGIASLYNLGVLVMRRLAQGRVQHLVLVHMIDMVISALLSQFIILLNETWLLVK